MDFTLNASVVVRYCNGGYIVKAFPWDAENNCLQEDTCIFTDVDTMLGYVKRVVLSLEGCSEPMDKLGPLQVPQS